MLQEILNHLDQINVSVNDIVYTCTINGKEQTIMCREQLLKHEHNLHIMRQMFRLTECKNLEECNAKFKEIVKCLLLNNIL